MESQSENAQSSESVRQSLRAISADRARIGEKVTAETWWTAPAQGLGAALIIMVPALGLEWVWLPLVLSIGIFVGVEVLFRKRSGLGITRPAGPRGLWILIALMMIFFFALMISLVLTLLGQIGWVLALAVTTGAATALIVVQYDRAHAAEVYRAG